MKRPVGITIIAILFILSGAWSAYEMVQDLFRSRFYINFGVLTIPVGIGLVYGRSSSRWWAKFWIGLMACACALMIFLPLLFGVPRTVEIFDKPISGPDADVIVVASVAIIVLIAWCMWRTLSSVDTSRFFAGPDLAQDFEYTMQSLQTRSDQRFSGSEREKLGKS